MFVHRTAVPLLDNALQPDTMAMTASTGIAKEMLILFLGPDSFFMKSNPIADLVSCQSRENDMLRNDVPFNSYGGYLRRKYGTKVYRVSVDGGFSCPHRAEDRSSPGCIFCDERGALAPYQRDSGVRLSVQRRCELLRDQIDSGVSFLRHRYRAESFLLYFQAFTCTNAPPSELKEIYDFGIAAFPFTGLIVSTRPDCVTPEVARLLSSYKSSHFDVWIELGLQSAQNETLKRINRGHTFEQFQEAYEIVQKHGLKAAVHLIFGLPGEDECQIMKTIELVADLVPDGVKIHNLHISSKAPIFDEYLRGELTVPIDERHIEYVIHALERLPQETVIMRLTCDTPDKVRAAPLRVWNKNIFFQRVRQEMVSRGTYQGRRYYDDIGSRDRSINRRAF